MMRSHTRITCRSAFYILGEAATFLSGDKFSSKRLGYLHDGFQTGVTDLGGVRYYYFLNWGDTKSIQLTTRLKTKARLENYWQGTDLGVHDGEYTVRDLPPHTGMVIKATAIKQ